MTPGRRPAKRPPMSGSLAELLLAAIVLPIVGAVKASDGEFYTYPVIGTRP